MADRQGELPHDGTEPVYDPCYGDPAAGWYGAHGAWEPCPVCDPSTPQGAEPEPAWVEGLEQAYWHERMRHDPDLQDDPAPASHT